MIDNSASMNDLAYVGDQGYCYDNTYTPTSGYAGNFDPDAWYYWYGPYNNFYKIADSTAGSLCSASEYDLSLAVRPPEASEKESTDDAVTRIELYLVNSTGGFDNTNCQLALEELQKESPNQGQLKQYIEDCMLYSQGQSRGFSNYMAAFNHSIHNCWYLQKHGSWPPGNGPTQSIMPACESVYTDDQYGTDPPDITTDSRGYVCYGDYSTGDGYVGRCWDPSIVTYKSNGNLDDPGWTTDECIEQALMDYCGVLTVPDVVDPSDQAAINRRILEHSGGAHRFRYCGPAQRTGGGHGRQYLCGGHSPFRPAPGVRPGPAHRRHGVQ